MAVQESRSSTCHALRMLHAAPHGTALSTTRSSMAWHGTCSSTRCKHGSKSTEAKARKQKHGSKHCC
ncbi:hypothetical protein OEZ85_007597 [Tetradesmus obliquus]|uniref:Secreted protein n=1 Tax=Tetradesmus obliquus TaxID=3088 RepID=A0ABY8TGE7_TETOB|nr:hypothetical protein OEZ85_007597 [Tetradesmus obliquus]